MEPVELTIYDRAELDQIMVALLQRRNRLSEGQEDVAPADYPGAQGIETLDRLIGRLNWDTAAAELEMAECRQ